MRKTERSIFVLLLSVVLLLIFMHFVSRNLSPVLYDRFNMDAEANIPTWYSTVLLFSVALASLNIYLSNKAKRYDESLWRFFWLGFSAAYCFFSIDEAARIHEILDDLKIIKWIVVYAPICGLFLIVSMYYFAVIRKDDRQLRNWVIGGLFTYVFGAIVAEGFSCLLYPLPPTMQHIEFVIEEGCELAGTIIVLMGCLMEIVRIHRSPSIDRAVQ
ncbi:MAG: hypothetical protein JW884_12495 [Deltaproteobacteria bacterium]|nr:hypothetical protein [Deltaproteobacteria bacterium]